MRYANAAHECYLTSALRLQSAMNELEGMIRGIVMDGVVNEREVQSLAAWIDEVRPLANVPPFHEFVASVARIVSDKRIDEQDKTELMWFFSRLVAHNRDYQSVASDMQCLHGILEGITADGVVQDRERSGLREWMEKCTPVRHAWPYDEISRLLSQVLEDGRICPAERDLLRCAFREAATNAES